MKIAAISTQVIIITCVICGLAFAADINALYEKFYQGLADIIEKNIDNPDLCAAEVDSYYSDNQDIIAQICVETKKALEAAAPLMEKAMTMSEEELEALQNQQAGKPQREAKMAPQAKRYTEAVREFIKKYPSQGMKISMKAMQLLPQD